MTARIPLPTDLAARPFSINEAQRLGLGRERLAGSDLVTPYRGVRTAAGTRPTLHQLCKALQDRLPLDAFFCGITAARLIGVPLPHLLERSPIMYVGVPAPRPIPTGRNVSGHRYRQPEITVRNGLRISSPTQVWKQLGRILPVIDLVAAGDFLIHWRNPLTTIDELRGSVADSAGGRCIRSLREALPYLHDRSESRKESAVRYLLARAGFEGLEVNFPISTSSGYRYRADFAFPRVKVLIEYQSGFHDDPERRKADMTRRSRLEADGWFVIEIHGGDLHNPTELTARIRQVISSREM